MKSFLFCILGLFATGSLSTLALAQERVVISEFNDAALSEWDVHSFEGETAYQVTPPAQGEQAGVLSASAQGSASGLIHEREIDLSKTPYLNWRWKLNEELPALLEQTKAGDDYAARIYVVIDGGWLFWKTKALNFVWSSRLAKGEQWPNAFAPDNALMTAVRDRSDKEGVWYEEKINVKATLEAWLGKRVDTIDGIALMTDTDNSGLSTAAEYGAIYFSAE